LGHSTGHGGDEDELVPKLVEAFAGKKVVGASAGEFHTAMWTEDGEVFTFGKAAEYGSLGHGGGNDQRVPLVVEARSCGSVKPVFKPRLISSGQFN